MREITAKKSCTHGECGWFEHLLFLFSQFFFIGSMKGGGGGVREGFGDRNPVG